MNFLKILNIYEVDKLLIHKRALETILMCTTFDKIPKIPIYPTCQCSPPKVFCMQQVVFDEW